MGWGPIMKRIFAGIGFLLLAQCASSAIVCEEGWNKYGEWAPCLRYHHEPGLTADRLGRRPIDERRVGKVEKVEKNIDGSVTVWRHGSPDTEEWRQINENTWERTR